jgi:ketosteroid isomerase-like protein
MKLQLLFFSIINQNTTVMRKFFTTIIFVSSVFVTSAQNSIDGLIEAEKNFAAFSVINGTKDAFLKFLDSTGIVFSEGKAVNGIELWSKREKTAGVLNWRPHFAGISMSGDLGFTTGPWTFQQTIHDTIIARGIYTTVWHKNKNGEWKFLVDIGVSNTPIGNDTSISTFESSANSQKSSKAALLESENNFVELSKEPAEAYKKYSSATTILNRNGILPRDANKKTLPKSIKYTVLGSGIALSGDLGYVYGTTTIDGKSDNYLRIWRRENGEWRIAVEVLRY